MNDEIIINGAVYVKKYGGQIIVEPNGAICCDAGFGTTEKKKQSIQDYCKEHRLWAAKDGPNAMYDYNNIWHFFRQNERPRRVSASPQNWGNDFTGYVFTDVNITNFITPDVPFDKSLIAPDGRLILIEGKKPKQKKVNRSFKVGKYYIAANTEYTKLYELYGIIFVTDVIKKNVDIWDIQFLTGKNKNFLERNLVPGQWKVINPPKKAKKKKLPARGELISCRNNDYDKQCPSTVRSFHHIDKATGKVHVWADGMYGIVSKSFYDSWKPFKLEDY